MMMYYPALQPVMFFRSATSDSTSHESPERDIENINPPWADVSTLSSTLCQWPIGTNADIHGSVI